MEESSSMDASLEEISTIGLGASFNKYLDF